jgi:hypothetical protein
MTINLYTIRKSCWRRCWRVYFTVQTKATLHIAPRWVASFSSERLALEWIDFREGNSRADGAAAAHAGGHRTGQTGQAPFVVHDGCMMGANHLPPGE